jgi:hypothetical protein
MLGRITLDLYQQDWKLFSEGINAVLEEANAICNR